MLCLFWDGNLARNNTVTQGKQKSKDLYKKSVVTDTFVSAVSFLFLEGQCRKGEPK